MGRLTRAVKFMAKRLPWSEPFLKGGFSLIERGRLRWDHWRYGDDYNSRVFTRFYQRNRWDDGSSRSGPGSNLLETQTLREDLAALLSDLSINRIVDVPCGDFYWMKEVAFPDGLSYVGGDIVAELIANNNRLYGTNRVSFRRMDLLAGPIPEGDLVLCRDSWVHFSFADVARAIRTLKVSGSTYLLVTHFERDRGNRDILTGLWRPLSLTAAPFCFPHPLRLIRDGTTAGNGKYPDKSLALYRLADLPDLSFDI